MSLIVMHLDPSFVHCSVQLTSGNQSYKTRWLLTTIKIWNSISKLQYWILRQLISPH